MVVFTRKFAWLRASIAVLLTALPAPTQSFERPNAELGPTVLHMSIVALDIDAISSAKQSFTANLFYMARWQDDRLTHDGPGNLVLAMDQAWTPDFQFTNQQRIFPTFREQLLVSPSGEVTYRQRVWGPFSQRLDLAEFPFDQHHFAVMLVPAGTGADTNEIQMIQDDANPSGIAPSFSLPDWDILSWEATPKDYNPLDRERFGPGFAFSFDARRHIGYFLVKLMLPLLLIVMMSWIVFWVDPSEMGTQISVSATSMLTLIAYRFMVGGSLPNISYLTRMDLFILCSTFLVFTTLIEAVITGTLARNGRIEQARRIDRVARLLFPVAMIVVILTTLVL